MTLSSYITSIIYQCQQGLEVHVSWLCFEVFGEYRVAQAVALFYGGLSDGILDSPAGTNSYAYKKYIAAPAKQDLHVQHTSMDNAVQRLRNNIPPLRYRQLAQNINEFAQPPGALQPPPDIGTMKRTPPGSASPPLPQPPPPGRAPGPDSARRPPARRVRPPARAQYAH